MRHEAIDDFVDVTGGLVGMDSIVMEFPVAKDASIAGLKAGDKIEAILEVDFKKGYGELTRISKAPRRHRASLREGATATMKAANAHAYSLRVRCDSLLFPGHRDSRTVSDVLVQHQSGLRARELTPMGVVDRPDGGIRELTRPPDACPGLARSVDLR